MRVRGALSKVFVLFLAISICIFANLNHQDATSSVEASEPDELVVIAVGDIACSPDNPYFNDGHGTADRCRHEAVVNAINKEPHIDVAVLLGDIQYQLGEYDAYIKSFAPAWSRIKADAILAVTGNHDYGDTPSSDSFRRALPETFGLRFVSFKDKTYGSWQRKGWNFIGLDSDCQLIGGCTPNDPQGTWLKQELTDQSNPCSLAFWHYPIFTSGTHPVNNMRPAWTELEQAGNDIVLNGHEHFYERFSQKGLTVPDNEGMREFIAGTGGYSLFNFLVPYAPGHEASTREYGYLKLVLKRGSYSWQFINEHGQVRDSGSDTCHGLPASLNKNSTGSTSHEPYYMPEEEEEE